MLNLIGQFIHRVRPLVYKAGLRPKHGSIWFSPSLSLKYAAAKAIEQTAKHFKK